MPPKRHFDFDSSSDAPEPSSEPGAYPTPAKRRHLTSTPVRSPPRSSDCSLYSEYSTPYTPYAKSVPSDSPSNPFGFVRKHVRLGLPKETSFSRHLALRFQVVSAPDLPPVRPKPQEAARVDHRGDPAFWECEGTYRIVQVPLNYSLAHIHALVLFLFNGDPSRAHTTPPPGETGYLFEAKRDISYYHEPWRSATLSGGTTWAKASRVQDPYYSAKSFAELVEASALNADELPFFEEDEDWSWENEDEFGLANVWPPGGDLSKAIVYRHDSQRVIHITVCTQTIPARKGVGNKPYVFRAYEDISLDPTPIEPSSVFPSPPKTQTLPNSRTTARGRAPHTPDPSPPDLTGSPTKGARQAKTLTTRNPSSNPFKSSPSKPAASIFPKSKASKPKNFKASLPSPSPSPSHDLDAEGSDVDEEDKFDGGLDPHRWNKHDAFSRFLARMAGPSPNSPGHTSPGPEDSPLRIPSSSSRSASSLGLPSSPSSSAYASADEGDADVFTSSSPLRLPVITPIHTHAPTRARIERAERRIREHTASVERTALEEEAKRAKREKEKAEREKKRALEKIKEEKERRAAAVGRVKAKDGAKKGVVERMRAKTRPARSGARAEEVRGGDGWDAVPASAGEVAGDDEEDDDGEEWDAAEEDDDHQDDDAAQEDEEEVEEDGQEEEEQDSDDNSETRAREEAHYAGYRAARRAEVIRLMCGGDGDGWADIPSNAGEAPWGEDEEEEDENPFDDGNGEREYDASYYEEEPDV
ncbi:hypothetical protein PENSPDRAFT_648486 [Peniophora sp. CONT]|nr:hypothetical protein PENSPDRAFT_648486 [Peniophora sp. CONT]